MLEKFSRVFSRCWKFFQCAGEVFLYYRGSWTRHDIWGSFPGCQTRCWWEGVTERGSYMQFTWVWKYISIVTIKCECFLKQILQQHIHQSQNISFHQFHLNWINKLRQIFWTAFWIKISTVIFFYTKYISSFSSKWNDMHLFNTNFSIKDIPKEETSIHYFFFITIYIVLFWWWMLLKNINNSYICTWNDGNGYEIW